MRREGWRVRDSVSDVAAHVVRMGEVPGSGCAGCRVRVQAAGFRVQGAWEGFRVQDAG